MSARPTTSSAPVAHDRPKKLSGPLPKSANDGGDHLRSERTTRTILVAELTREARRALGWSEDAAAAVAGVSRALYREWEEAERDDHSTEARTPLEYLFALKDDARGLAVFGRAICGLLGWVPGVRLAGDATGRSLLTHVTLLSRERHESTEAIVGAACEASPGGADATDDELATIEAQLLEDAAAIQSALADVRARRKGR